MRYFAVVLAIAAGIGIYSAANPKPACAQGVCVSGICYSSSQCVGDCVCLREGSDPGRCVSISID